MPTILSNYTAIRDQLVADIKAARPTCSDIAFVESRIPMESRDYVQVGLNQVPMSFDGATTLEQTWEFTIVIVVPWPDTPPDDVLGYLLGIADDLIARLEAATTYASVAYRPHVFAVDPSLTPMKERTHEVSIGFRCFTAKAWGS